MHASIPEVCWEQKQAYNHGVHFDYYSGLIPRKFSWVNSTYMGKFKQRNFWLN